ncbi:MAG: CDP-diacylglycerol--serine O-phosphatidyltransferase [Prevotellaceae bacterium]|jgi:CDP-diacylglycerol--serine O-phosphatidyltransferase|nr:CDP-diacylglycerol--serine O-phosphatidyltransferase [Prevotellaceae bacterium]
MKPLTKYVPNSITLLNMFFGCVAVVLALRGWVNFAGYCIFLAAVCDFLDGMSARLLKAYSEIGKQLDSLADLVSFGLAPAAILHTEMEHLLRSHIAMDFSTLHWEIVIFFPFVLTLFSALRLAKFNIDTRQSNVFLGLPTPASALFVAAFLMNSRTYDLLNGLGIIAMVALLSLLMVINLPMLALKFKGLGWSSNKFRYIFLCIAALIVCFTVCAGENFTLSVSLIIVAYTVYSLILYLINKLLNIQTI